MPPKPKLRNKPARCLQPILIDGKSRYHGYRVYFAGEYISVIMVAMFSGISKAFISKVFSGKKNPTLAYCIRLADALDMDLGEFVKALVAHTTIYDKHTKEFNDKRRVSVNELIRKFPDKFRGRPRKNPLSTSTPTTPTT
jgi:Helix-turn-helix